MNLWGTLTILLFSGAWIPQIVKTGQVKSTSDLSLGSLVLPFLGGVCGSIYTYQVRDWTLFVGYLLGLLCTGTLVTLWFVYQG